MLEQLRAAGLARSAHREECSISDVVSCVNASSNALMLLPISSMACSLRQCASSPKRRAAAWKSRPAVILRARTLEVNFVAYACATVGCNEPAVAMKRTPQKPNPNGVSITLIVLCKLSCAKLTESTSHEVDTRHCCCGFQLSELAALCLCEPIWETSLSFVLLKNMSERVAVADVRTRQTPRPLLVIPSIAAAATAACCAVLITNIPETIKTRLQLDGEGGVRGIPRQYRGVTDAFVKIWRHEGLRGLHAGLSAGLAYQFVMNGARLGLYEPLQRVFRRATGADADSSALKVAAAASSGAVGAALGSPLYLIKTRLQAQSAYFSAAEKHSYTGLFNGLHTVFQSEGVRGLLRGLDGALPRVMLGSATQLTTYDACKRWAGRTGVPDGFPTFFVSSLATSFITVTVMNPLDVISSRLYQSAGKATAYSGPIDCGLQTVRAEGVWALQKGWLAQYARLGPHTILTFVALEQIKPAFARVDAFVDKEAAEAA